MKTTVATLDLGHAPIGPLLVKMSVPSIASMLVIALYNFIDIYWLSRISADAMAALTVAFAIQIVISAIGIGTGMGVGSYAARMLGEGRQELANRTAGQAIFLSLFLGLLTLVVGTCFAPILLKVFGARGSILSLAGDYLVTFAIGTPFTYSVVILSNLFRAEGNPRLAMYLISITGAIGMCLDPFLILGIGPFPRLGVQGAALSFVSAHLLTTAASLHHLTGNRSSYRIRWRDLIPDLSVITAIYRVGGPSFIMNITFGLVMAVFNHVLGAFGAQAIAVLGLLFRINGILAWVVFGIGQGVMPLVGFNYGAKLYGRLTDIVSLAVKASTIIAGVYSLAIILLAEPVISIFTQDPALLAMAVPALRIFMSLQILLAPIIIWVSLFNGLGKGFTSMLFLTLRDTVFLIPFLLIFAHYFGFFGVWLAQPVSNSIVFVLLYFRTRQELKIYRNKLQAMPSLSDS